MEIFLLLLFISCVSICILKPVIEYNEKDKEFEYNRKLNFTRIQTITEQDICPICLDKLSLKPSICISKCKHIFHHDCILTWLQIKDICPICNTTIVTYI